MNLCPLYQYRRCVLQIKVGAEESGKLVVWAACVFAKRDHWVSQTFLLWSAIFACVYCSINSCPCENTHGKPFCPLYVCRIGLCARDYHMYSNFSSFQLFVTYSKTLQLASNWWRRMTFSNSSLWPLMSHYGRSVVALCTSNSQQEVFYTR